MPNWTRNSLVVRGPAREVGRMLAIIRPNGPDEDGDEDVQFLARLLPMPPEYLHTVEGSDQYGPDPQTNKYQSALETWGCKWPDKDARVDATTLVEDWASWTVFDYNNGGPFAPKPTADGEGRMHLTFDTPWGEPDVGLTEIARRWPRLTFELWSEYEGGEAPSHQTFVADGSDD